MACGEGTEDGVPPGPWGSLEREGESFWREDGDEETLPLLRSDREEHFNPSYEPFLPGPWEVKSLNAFEPNVWLPLRCPLAPQEKLENR